MSPRPRAQRVSTSIPVLYRHPGEATWLESRALNLSASGILFGPAQLHSGTQVEVMLSPQERVGPVTTGPQIYAGEVVRTTPTGDAAVRFDESWFVIEA
jgi:hypothetical protein